MTEDQDTTKDPSDAAGATEDESQEESQPESGSARRGFSDGVRQGLGVLSAFKEALEETIHDARERGDLSADRAKELLQGAMAKAKEAAGEAKDRIDFVTQQEFDRLSARVDELEAAVKELGGDENPASDSTDEEGL